MIISLVIPTYNRSTELEELLLSISQQTVSVKEIEVIVVDQNEKIDLSSMLKSFSDKLHIRHVKTSIKGIAHSKNIGLKAASAVIVSFPDDDCTFYNNTVENVLNAFKELPDADILYGKVYDRQHKKNIMRNWPRTTEKLNKLNFHLKYSAITCFTKDKSLQFDERFGVGSKYGVGEELDYIMQALRKNDNIYYCSSIDVWHPELNVSVMSEEKNYYYSRGYGATFRKNFIFQFFLIFMFSCIYQLILCAVQFLKGNKIVAKKRWLAFKGRIHGFTQFR